ncbi:MAG: metallophosphoesterase [Pseudomonadota bacterium]
MSFRIAVITDIHHGVGREGERGGSAISALNAFVDWTRETAPDFVLDLGDRIADQTHSVDLRLEREVSDVLAAVDAPVLHINGNHDRDNLSVADNEKILGQGLGHEVRDLGAWRLLLWRAETRFERGVGMALAEEDVSWLETALGASDKPALLASHVPPFVQDMTGNHFFQENAEIATYCDIARVTGVLEQARCPLVTVSGHVHWTTAEQRGGIWHLTQQALTETYQNGHPAMAWGMMELGEDVAWEVFGADPMALRFRPTARRWAKPLPRFEDMPARSAALG